MRLLSWLASWLPVSRRRHQREIAKLIKAGYGTLGIIRRLDQRVGHIEDFLAIDPPGRRGVKSDEEDRHR